MPIDQDRYLARIGFERRIANDVETLEALQRAHLSAVPFENLDVYARVSVCTDPARSLAKIVDGGRGGWCFEANGAFAELLEALGFSVRRLGAAVQLGGPNDVVDHLTLEVEVDEPYLVDVGFGESFIRPLAINRAGPQDGGTGVFEFVPGGRGTTLVRHGDDGGLEPQYRFTRLVREMEEFEPASQRLQSDPALHWRQKPFATRLIDGGPDRVTLLRNRLKLTRAGETVETPVGEDEWVAVLDEWFAMDMPAPGTAGGSEVSR